MIPVHLGNLTPMIIRDTVVGLVRSDSADLTARQMSILLICFTEDDPVTVSGLAHRLNVSKPAVTRAIERLEQLDLVRRANDAHDRRRVLTVRTAPGAAYVAHIRSLMQAAAKAHGLSESDVPTAHLVTLREAHVDSV